MTNETDAAGEISVLTPITETHDNGNFETGSDIHEVSLGEWYWVNKGHETEEWFGCLTQIGSNYVEITGQSRRWSNSTMSDRIHFDDYWKTLTFEPNPREVLAGRAGIHQKRAAENMDKVRELTARLGLSSTTARLGGPKLDSSSTALATLSGQEDVNAFKTELIKAQDITLPELFKAIEFDNKMMASWMAAEAIGIKALLNPMKASLKEIAGRIFNISLYAGLNEGANQITEGAPASADDKLHVMQRRLYMDEECLLQYEGGGMTFEDIHAFDDWLARPENMNRLLPFPKTLVGFRVRRIGKTRYSNTFLQAFINIQLAEADEFTYFYIRNGDQLWRIVCELEFGATIFPAQSVFDPSRARMVPKSWRGKAEDTITRDDYDQRCLDEVQNKIEKAENLIKSEQWKLDNPEDEWKLSNPQKDWRWANPFTKSYGDDPISWFHDFSPDNWVPLDQSNVYIDDYMDEIKARFEQYNRIALIIQGLFDRSMVLHPHYPVQTWNPASFANSIELVYDGGMNLYDGEKPDFQAYWASVNAQIDENSVLIGQETVWMRREAERENAKAKRNWRTSHDRRDLEFYQPYGNEGPGRLAVPTEWKPRSRKAVFRWKRGRQTYNRWGPRDDLDDVISVDAADVFNISAYKPGDFKQFFLDPRTRADYVKWAPFLLAAEDYHAKKNANNNTESDV